MSDLGTPSNLPCTPQTAQRQGANRPDLDPIQVRILFARLGDAASLREADPQAVCGSGGAQYNSTTRGLFRSLRRHLERAWAQ